jgi:hypothetical protein
MRATRTQNAFVSLLSRTGQPLAALSLILCVAVSIGARPALAQVSPWAGTYANAETTMRVQASGSSLSATSTYTPNGADHAKQGSEDTFGCTISGDTAICSSYSGRYWDQDKTITYTGTAKLSLAGGLSVVNQIDSATPQWKPGVAAYTPAVHPGAEFAFTLARASPAPATASSPQPQAAPPAPPVEPPASPTPGGEGMDTGRGVGTGIEVITPNAAPLPPCPDATVTAIRIASVGAQVQPITPTCAPLDEAAELRIWLLAHPPVPTTLTEEEANEFLEPIGFAIGLADLLGVEDPTAIDQSALGFCVKTAAQMGVGPASADPVSPGDYLRFLALCYKTVTAPAPANPPPGPPT